MVYNKTVLDIIRSDDHLDTIRSDDHAVELLDLSYRNAIRIYIIIRHNTA